MTIVITGATGQLGRLTLRALLDRGVPAADLLATGRDPARIADLAVPTRRASYDDPAALRDAFAGADRVLFVSGNEVGRRVPQHRNVVEAAAAAGVGHVFYTSITRADTSPLRLAEEHRATETLLRESGLAHSLLRNSWYTENWDLAAAVEHGTLVGAAGAGRISAAPRADYAGAAAALLLAERPARVYELGGEPITLAELAAEVTRRSGRPVAYNDLGEAGYAEFLTGAGLPAAQAAVIADADARAADGALLVDGTDLADLLGRPATPLAEAVRRQLAGAADQPATR